MSVIKYDSQDQKIYVMVNGRYGHLSRSMAVKQVAYDLGMSRSGVSGCETRARNDPLSRAALMEYQAANPPRKSDAQKKIEGIIRQGKAEIKEFYKSKRKKKLYPVIFASDIHFPQANFQSLRILYKIIDIVKPVMISGLNDGLDFSGISRHEDVRPLYEQAFDDDTSNTLRMYSDYINIIKSIVPDILVPNVNGNHDIRVALIKDENKRIQISDTLVLSAMEYLSDAGVSFDSKLDDLNVFEVNPNFIWYHGASAAAKEKTRCHKNFEYIQRKIGYDRVFNFVTGHVHKGNEAVKHDNLNVENYQSSCLCNEDMAYLRYKANWTQGITLSYVDLHGTYNKSHRILFEKDSKGMFCHFINGDIIRP